jgi:CRP-like cAMP-binding protein
MHDARRWTRQESVELVPLAERRQDAARDPNMMPDAARGLLEGAEEFVSAAEQSVPARRLIFRERDALDFVPLICRGWAACSVTLFDGRRQILSFLLPGDMAPTAMMFDPVAHVSIEAVTDVQFRAVQRAGLKAALLRDPGLFERFSSLWAAEKMQADQLAVDLGRRSADERIARLILGLADRMRQRGLGDSLGEDLGDGDSFEFPLRQHHIADATGLTSVHVSKVLTEFRRAGWIEINERALTIKDPAAFRSIANMR